MPLPAAAATAAGRRLQPVRAGPWRRSFMLSNSAVMAVYQADDIGARFAVPS
jgi:hypothetical protein